METNRFESKCWRCEGRITTKDGGATWRHDVAPAERHPASAHGAMKQI